MNDEKQIFKELKELILENAPNLRDNARKQLKTSGQTDDETTLHLATHVIFLSSERLGVLTKWLIGLTIILGTLTIANLLLLLI